VRPYTRQPSSLKYYGYPRRMVPKLKAFSHVSTARPPKSESFLFDHFQAANMPALKSSLFFKSNDLGGYSSGPAKRNFGPFTYDQYNPNPKYHVWLHYLRHTPSLQGARSERDQFKRTPTSLCTFPQ